MMNLITVRDLRNRSGEIWRRLAQQQELIVTSNGRPIALLTPVSEDNVEKTLAVLRRARAQVAVSRMRETAATTGANRLTLDDVNEEIHKARQERSV
jgi:prevent-host-death family protein